ncbi:MAG: hypothetical protein J6T96_09900 [Bacteroidales bacterium]|nr:hypothetical protein [Bacteroidales bacterium]MBO7462895.1 hypothetical protein [Bacteroidales bacterium]MBP5683451.1 hypothetical protein [Bacteroidales bacterium]
MKRIISAIVALMVYAVMMVSCGGGSGDTPSQVFEKSFNASMTGDINTLKAITEGITDEELQSIKEEASSPEADKIRASMKLKVLSEQIAADGKTATVKYQLLMDGQVIEEKEAPLVKTDSGWKVKNK